MESLSQSERDAVFAELKEIEQGLARALRDRIPPESPALAPLIGRHFAWVKARWGREAPVSAYAGLADIYLAHPDFVARYERIQPGFAEFLAKAMRSWAARR